MGEVESESLSLHRTIFPSPVFSIYSGYRGWKTTSETYRLSDDIEENLKYVFNTPNVQVIFVCFRICFSISSLVKIETLALSRLEKKDYPLSKSIYLVLPNLDAKGSSPPQGRCPSQLLILGAVATRRTETKTSIQLVRKYFNGK